MRAIVIELMKGVETVKLILVVFVVPWFVGVIVLCVGAGWNELLRSVGW